jgi:hypothetical protein
MKNCELFLKGYFESLISSGFKIYVGMCMNDNF